MKTLSNFQKKNNSATVIRLALIIAVLLFSYGLVYGQSGNALSFTSASSQYVDVGDASFKITTGTWEAWFKVNSFTGSRQTIISKDATGYYDDGWLGIETDDRIYFYIDNSNLSYYPVYSDSTISSGIWYHIAVTWGSGGMAMYVNGILQTDTDANTSGIASSGTNLSIGARGSEGDNYFNGEIDEVRIWNDARTQAEIKEYMNQTITSESNLIAYYQFDETSGTSLPDQTGSNSGTLVNSPAWVTSGTVLSDPGNTLDFDGTDDRVEVTDNAVLDFTTPTTLTLEAWIKPSYRFSISPIICKRYAGASNGYVLYINSWGTDDQKLVLESDTTSKVTTDNPVITWGNWQHVAIVVNGTTPTFYVDGSLVSSTGTVTISPNTEPLYLSFFDGMPSYIYSGELDEVRIWNDVRTQTEIQNNMHNTLNPASEGNLVAYYRFDQGGGTTLTDYTSNNNHGTLQDSPSWTTSEAMCPIVNAASDVTTTSFTANWDAVNGATGYRIDVDDASDFTSLIATNLDAGTGTSFSVTGLSLSTGTLYYYRVRAEKSTWTSPDSAPVSFMVPPGYTLDFDGTDDYITTPLYNSLTASTVEAWIKADDVNSKQIIIDNGGGGGAEKEIQIYVENGFMKAARWYGNSGEVSYAISTGIWYHFSAVYTSSEITLYVNGTLADTQTGLSNPNVESVNWNWGIGSARESAAGYFFNGQIDEVRIWGDVRTQTEIQNNMYKTLTGNEANLLAYYRFDRTLGTALADLAGNSDGTLTNGPVWTSSTAPVGAPILSTTSASSVTKTSAQTGGNITDQNTSAVTARGVCYNNTGNPTTTDATVVDGSPATGSFISSITGLLADTTYYVRSYATNTSGTSYGSETTFTTSQPSLTIDDVIVAEGTNITFTVTLDAASSNTVTVSYATADSSATTADSDYTYASGTLTFNPGITTQTVTVTVTGDTKYETDETFYLNLSGQSNASITDSQGLGTITNNDAQPSVTLGLSGSPLAENGGMATVTANLSNLSNQGVTVNLVFGGTASNGTDYTASGSSIFISAGTVTSSITLTGNNDTPDENDETVTVNIDSVSNGSESGTQQVTASITDDDPLPTLTVNDITVTEGNSGTVSAVFSVALNTPSGKTVTVNYSSGDGTASVSDSDYTAVSGTLTFTPGTTTQTVTVSVNGDARDEDSETFYVNLSAPSNANISDSQGAGTINNDDTSPSLVISDATVTEGTVNAAFTVTLSAASGRTVTVYYASADNTATTSDSDYTAVSGTLTFSPGTTTQTVNVSINGDTKDEDNETFYVNLSAPSNASVSDSQGIGTVNNDDSPSSLSVSDATVTEGNSGTVNAAFTVTLAAPSGKTATVNYASADNTAATADSDYTPVSGTLTFSPGVTTQTIDVSTHGDTKDEDNETFYINLSDPSNASVSDSQATGTINNDDTPPSLSIGDTAVTEGSSGTVTATFTVTLSAASGKTVTVNYASGDNTAATADSDYTSASGTLTFAPGVTSQTVTVAVTGDTKDEDTETFYVNLSAPSNASVSDSQATGTINNDDTAPSLYIGDITADEGDSGTAGATFTVTLSQASGRTVTVNYTTADNTATTADSDYTSASGTLTFNPGATSQTITVTVHGDTEDEETETFYVNLSAPSNAVIADSQGIGTITGTDAPPSLGIADTTVAEGDSGTVSATFTVTLGAASGKTVTVNYATADNTSTTADSDYTPASGTLTFNPGVTAQTFAVTVNSDTRNETDENFYVNLSAPSNADISDSQGIGTITNDDTQPSVTLGLSWNILAEDSGTATLTATLSDPSFEDVTVNFDFSGSATGQGTDYTASGNSVVIPAGMSDNSITLTGNNDFLDEDNETVIIDIGSVVNGTELGTQQVTAVIADDDSLPSLDIDNASVSEGDSGTVTAQFFVTLSPASGKTVTVDYATADVTASAGDDYSTVSGTLSFSPGQTSKIVEVIVFGDVEDEADETFQINLSEETGASLVGSQGICVIQDDDICLIINEIDYDQGADDTAEFIEIMNISESPVSLSGYTIDLIDGAGPAVYKTVILNSVSLAPGDYYVVCDTPDSEFNCDQAVSLGNNFIRDVSPGAVVLKNGSFDVDTVSYAGSAGGYTETAGADPDSSTKAHVSLSRYPDGTDTNDNSTDFSLHCITPGGSNNITDSSGCFELAINDVTVTEGHTGTVTAQFSVSLSHAGAASVTVNYATADSTASAGTDYTAAGPTTITFAAGDNTDKTISVTVSGDYYDEDDEIFYVNLTPGGNVSAADTRGICTITDDDTAGFTVTPASGLTTGEDGRSSSFTLSLQSRPDADVTISASSSDSTEGTVSPSSLTFTGNNWNTAQTVTVTGTDDEETDGSSAYTVVLSPASSADTGYSGADPEDVSVTNADDDSPGFTVSAASEKTAEDGTQAVFTVRLNTEPWATLVIDVVSSDTGEGTVSPAQLKFTRLDWNTDQTVTVTGVYDTLADGDQEYAVQLAVNAENTTDSTYKKLDPTDVSLTNLDLDIPPTTSGIAGITVSEDAADTVIDLWEAFDDAHDGDEGLVWSVKNNTNETLFSSVKTDAGRYLVLSYAENAEGAAYITVSATDTGGLSADTTFSVTVSATDDPPAVAIPIPDVSVNEDAPDTVIDMGTVFADADNDDAAIVKSVRTNTNSALVAATAEGNTLTLVYQADQTGTAEITILAESGGKTVTDTFTVFVNSEDDPAVVANPVSDVTADEDAADTLINLELVFTDNDGDDSAITKILVSNTNPGLVTSVISGNTLTLDFQEDQSGTASITIRGTSDGKTADDTFEVTVNAVDDPPVVANGIADFTANEDSADTIIDLTNVFTDTDNDDSAISKSVQSNKNETLVAAAISGNTLRLGYQTGQSGASVITITGASNGQTVTDEFNVKVGDINSYITGKVAYFSSGASVPNVTLALTRADASYTAVTDTTGAYLIQSIASGLDYVLTPSCTDHPDPGSLSSTDASRIARYRVGLVTFTEAEIKAADVTENGTVTSLDASNVARYKVGLITQLNDKNNHWTFQPGSAEYSPLESDMKDQNFVAVRLGDVSGNWTSGSDVMRKSAYRSGISEEFFKETVLSDQGTISVPVILDYETAVEGIDITVRFDENVLESAGAVLADVLENKDYDLLVNDRHEGQISLAIFARNEMFTGSGTVAFISFDVLEQGADSTTLTFTEFTCNETPVYAPGLRAVISLPGADDTGENLMKYDLNGDGRVGLQDAVLGLSRNDLGTVIRALQCVAGMK
ncbi:MAG: hypothetical protein GY795_25345 [Desulfobacterales bacterium]|nr:hypothetical protein [Desulfobacterales bacterium]